MQIICIFMHCLISPEAGLLVFKNASVSRIVNMVPLVFLFFGFSLYFDIFHCYVVDVGWFECFRMFVHNKLIFADNGNK